MVTYPVEKAVSTVNGVKYVSSISRQGASLVTIFLQLGNESGQRPVGCSAGGQSDPWRSPQGRAVSDHSEI